MYSSIHHGFRAARGPNDKIILSHTSRSAVRSFWGLSRPGHQSPFHPCGVVGSSDSSIRAHSTANSSTTAETGSTDTDLADDENPADRRQRVEAVLLLAKGPLSPRKLAQMASIADATEARTHVRELNDHYKELGRAFRVELIAGGYRILTRPAIAPWLSRLSHVPTPVRLSTPMMETLAVVAYRGPVSRADVESVRGVACGELLRQLMEQDLIRIAGRSKDLGRPYLYDTTKRFLQLFGLANSNALPPINWQALQDDDPPETTPSNSITDDLSFEDSSKSTKEPDVSQLVSPMPIGSVLPSQDSSETVAILGTDESVDDVICPVVDPAIVDPDTVDPAAVIEDEEDDLYEGIGSEDDDDDWDDEDDDDWDDDDDDDEDSDDDLEEDDWEEVDDDDDDDDEWDDEEDDSDKESSSDDWDDDDIDDEDSDDDDDEDWD